MLKFMRNKIVGIERFDGDTILAHGVLDDEIYGLELDVSICISDMIIRSIEGRFKRWTTPECPKAIPVLQEAIGFHLLEREFSQKVQKNIGRKGCRHFATLLIECCAAAQQACKMILGEEAKRGVAEDLSTELPSSGRKKEKSDRGERKPAVSVGKQAGAKDSMLIDLHIHTFPASQCSVAKVDDVIKEAKRIGLDGLCLTDHNFLWDKADVMGLRRKHDFLILRGSEITTDQGDMLVFGLEMRVNGISKLQKLKAMASEAGGFVIAAHPFRGFLLFGADELGLTPEKVLERPVFKWVDGIEVLNSKVTDKENEFASEVAKRLSLPGAGGSDAHQISEVGIHATMFHQKIEDEEDLVEALRGGKYSAVSFRKGT